MTKYKVSWEEVVTAKNPVMACAIAQNLQLNNSNQKIILSHEEDGIVKSAVVDTSLILPDWWKPPVNPVPSPSCAHCKHIYQFMRHKLYWWDFFYHKEGDHEFIQIVTNGAKFKQHYLIDELIKRNTYNYNALVSWVPDMEKTVQQLVASRIWEVLC